MFPPIPDSETIPAHKLADVEALRLRLHEQMLQRTPIYLDYQPGNGGRYEIVLQWMGQAWELDDARSHAYDGTWLVSIVNKGCCMLMSDRGTVSAAYVAQKLGIARPDAVAVAYLLAAAPEG